MSSAIHSAVMFLVELLILYWEFFKVMFWTVFYFLFSPNEKFVRNVNKNVKTFFYFEQKII